MPILTGFGPNPRGPKSGQWKLADLDALDYELDLKRNEIAARTIPNPSAGREHRFVAYRVALDADKPVALSHDFHSEDSEDEDQ